MTGVWCLCISRTPYDPENRGVIQLVAPKLSGEGGKPNDPNSEEVQDRLFHMEESKQTKPQMIL